MSSVEYHVRDAVAHVVLNDPAKHNSMSEPVQNALIDALTTANTSTNVTAILLSAKGESFCAGGDLRLMHGYRSRPASEVYQEARRSASVFQTLATLEKPIVAAVNGPAFGGGFGLVCASSIVVASDCARFGCTELKLGIFPLVILPAVRRALGDRKALEISLTAETFDAQAAQAMGIVNHVVPASELMQKAETIAARIAGYSPYAVRLGMRAFRDTTGMPHDKAIEHLLGLRVVISHSEDLHEGASAFLEKRKPVWQGR